MNPILIGLVIALLAAAPALAQVAATGLDANALAGWLSFAVMAMIGGVLSFYQKVKAGKARWLNFNELIGEMFTSAFVGVMVGWLAQPYLPTTVVFAMAGISGHIGGRLMFWLERTAQHAVEARLGVGHDPNTLELKDPQLPKGE